MGAGHNFRVVSPLGRRARKPIAASQRQVDLSGKTVCELWDLMFKGEVIYPEIREALKERYTDLKFVDHTHFGNVHGANQNQLIADLPQLLKQHGCDVVISGIGA